MVPSCFFCSFLAPNQPSENTLPHLISNGHVNKTSFCKQILDEIRRQLTKEKNHEYLKIKKSLWPEKLMEFYLHFNNALFYNCHQYT